MAVASDLKLLDGKHRRLAYRKKHENEDPEHEITVDVYPVTTPHEQLKLAAKLNSEHGWQLTDEDKETTAKSLFAYGMSYEEIASTLSVGKKKVSDWLARTVKERKVKRDKKIQEMWLACYSQEEIAKACDCDQSTIVHVTDDFMKSVLENQNHKLASLANHATDFEIPIYNIWKQQE